MRDLQGARVTIVAGTVVASLALLVASGLQFFGVMEPAGDRLVDGPTVIPLTAGALAQTVGLVLWLRGATQNQEHLGHPTQGNVWIRAILGILVPILGAYWLFQVAGRLLDASSQAAGRPHHLGAWFGFWVVAYLVLEVTWVFADVLMPLAAANLAVGAATLLALPGLHRFLRTIEDAQEHAHGIHRAASTPPLDPATSPASTEP